MNPSAVWSPQTYGMNPEPDASSFWSPRTNVFVSDTGDLIIKYELSSMRSENLEITLESNRLRVTGVRYDQELGNSRQQLVKEYPVGSFDRIVSVPDGFDVGAAKAAYLNGILSIIIPRKGDPSGSIEPPARIKFD